MLDCHSSACGHQFEVSFNKFFKLEIITAAVGLPVLFAGACSSVDPVRGTVIRQQSGLCGARGGPDYPRIRTTEENTPYYRQH